MAYEFLQVGENCIKIQKNGFRIVVESGSAVLEVVEGEMTPDVGGDGPAVKVFHDEVIW